MTNSAIAIAQFSPGHDPEANRAEISRLAALAAHRGAGVVLFPEYSSYFVNPFDETLAAHAESIDGPFVAHLVALAAAHELIVVAGFLEHGEGDRVRNAVVAVDGGGVRAAYRKVHLYDAFGQRESDWVEAGDPGVAETFEAGGMRFGMMTCYDLRFPESARMLADAGADVALVPAQWVRGPLKEHHWRTLIAARAIENTMYVAAVDHTPPLGVGNSLVVDPLGTSIAGVATATDVAVAHADPALVADVRRANPALQLRRYRVAPA